MKTIFYTLLVVGAMLLPASKGVRDGVIALVKSVASGLERIAIRGDYAEIRYVDDSEFDMAVAEPGRVIVVVFQNELTASSRSETAKLDEALKRLPAKVLIAKVVVERNQSLLERLHVSEVPTIRVYMAGKMIREYKDKLDENEIVRLVNYHVEHPPQSTAHAYMGPMKDDWLPKGVKRVKAEKPLPVTPLDPENPRQ